MASIYADLTSTDILFAIIAGLISTLFWLWFWLKEDEHPEPARILALTFLGGMMMAVVALFLEQLLHYGMISFFSGFSPEITNFVLLFLWATTEEYLKYFAARKLALGLPFFDEPVDALVYLIAAALGFATIENILFLLKVCGSQGLTLGFVTINLRFLGATLLHVVSSAIIGASIAFSFFHKENLRRNIFWGFLLAISLHTFFNYFIIKNASESLFKIFIPLWLAVIIIIFIFEKIKKGQIIFKNNL